LIVGGWGKPEPDFSTKLPGYLFALDVQTKAKTLITPKPLGNIDGRKRWARGGYGQSTGDGGALRRKQSNWCRRPVVARRH
jgi:hypothetical protein